MGRKVNHLEMIQGIVNRLAKSSFLLKGWTVILVSALFALAAKDSKIYFIYLAYFPGLAFWGLDGYYLRQERLFRKLYESKVKEFNENSKKIQELFTMNVKSYESEVNSIPRLMISTSEILYYLAFLIIIIFFLIVYITVNWNILV